jgi:Tle cognate immunity protein 4 C-terminal domain
MLERGRKFVARLFATCLLATLLGGCQRQTKDEDMNLPANLGPMRTHCVGRYLIDLPAALEQSPLSEVELYYGLTKDFETVKVRVADQTRSPTALKKLVDARVADLQANHHFESPSKNMFAARVVLADGVEAVQSYKSSRRIETLNHEVFFDRGAAVGLASAFSFKGDSPEQLQQRLFMVAKSSQATGPDINTVKPGTCLGPLVIDAGQDGEVFGVAFTSTRIKDLFITIDMNSMVAKSDGGLLARRAANSGLLAKLNFQSTVLRKGASTIGGRPAEELLEAGKDREKRVLGFYGETLLQSPSRFDAPQIAIEMKMGGQVEGLYIDASLSDKEALLLWDAVIKSIRLRPGSM